MKVYGNSSFGDEPAQSSVNYLLETLQLVVCCILLQAIAIVGSVGNIITLLVLYRNGLKSTTNILLFSLAICDLIFLLTQFLRRCVCVIGCFDLFLSMIYQAFIHCYVWMPGRLACHLSTSHVVFISIERFIAVVYPFKVSKWISRDRAMGALVVMFVFHVLESLPWLLAYLRIQWIFNEMYNQTVPVVTLTEFYTENQYVLDFFGQMLFSIRSRFLYPALVVGSSGLIAYKLHQVSKMRLKITTGQAERMIDVKVSRMLLAVCLVYLMSNIPPLAAYIYVEINPYIKMTEWYSFAFDVEEFMYAINSSANFVLYTLMSSKFNQTVKVLLCCGPKKCKSK